MGSVDVWPHLREFCHLASSRPHPQVWLFGSALTTESDLDVLLIYVDREDVVAVRSARWWPDFDPPLRITAMTADEERHYGFIAATDAKRLV